jgi:hypothetical protein
MENGMKATLTFLGLVAILLVAGCKTVQHDGPPWDNGEAYTDVVVPGNYIKYNDPPFKRQDGAGGKRIYGRYAYRSKGNGVDDAQKVLDFLKGNMAHEGWELMVEEAKPDAGTMMARFKKGDDQVLLTLAPDRRVQASERFSILTVEMNPKFD